MLRRVLTSMLLLMTVLTGAPAFAATPVTAEEYDSRIRDAREGRTEPALDMLRQMGDSASLNARYDHILIASWANRPDEVLAVYERLPAVRTPHPANVTQAVARAFRELGRWPESLAMWRAGLGQYPQDIATFTAGLTLTLADAGQLAEAITTGLNAVARFPDNVDLRLALAYAYVLSMQPFEALFHTDKAWQLAPHSPWVEAEYIRALQRAGLSEHALEWAKQTPGRFTPAQMRALEADVAALKTRLAAMPSRSEVERFVIADRALARYDELLFAWRALGAEAANDVRRIRVDRLAALHARVRMDELVREYEALLREGVPIPPWALPNVASAYLYLRKPARARDLYRVVLADLEASTPPAQRHNLGVANERLENQMGLLDALIETEQFNQIGPLLAEINDYRAGDARPALLYFKGNPLPDPNADYLDMQMTALATASLAADDTPTAQKHLEAMVNAAPNNTNLHTALAGVYLARSQPRRAETQLKLAETMTPRALSLENAQGEAALDLQEWRQAEELSADTIARFPEDRAAQRLARQWEVHNKGEVRISVNKGLASDSPVAGSGGVGIDAVVYTPPFGYNWRIFSGLGYAQGRYEEGAAYAYWQRAGLEWRRRGLWAEAEVLGHRYGYGTKTGLRLAAAVDFNDYLQLGVSGERRSRETPLRALGSDISSHTLDAYLRWRAHERREWQLGVAAAHFSDGNDRRMLSVTGSERVYTHPHMQLDLLFDIAAQHNDMDEERPYFNPKRDLTMLPSVRMTHILHRRYQTVWEQFATLSTGLHLQPGYGVGSVLGLAYGQRYRYNDVLELALSMNAVKRPYDGERGHEAQLLFDLVSRF